MCMRLSKLCPYPKQTFCCDFHKIILYNWVRLHLNSKPKDVRINSPWWLYASWAMLGLANVKMKGPSVWNAGIRTHRITSASRLANTGASTFFRVCSEQAQDTDMITSAHALRTLQSLSLASSQNLGSWNNNMDNLIRISFYRYTFKIIMNTNLLNAKNCQILKYILALICKQKLYNVTCLILILYLSCK